MREKLSAERLEGLRTRLAVFDVQQCGVFATEPMVRELLGHFAAQDEEIAQLRAVHEAELGVCEQHCEVVKRLRELLREWTDMDPLRYDSEYSACPWCDFSYSKMQHERDCAFVLARAECGVDAAVEGRD
jgi:hypothetical protein